MGQQGAYKLSDAKPIGAFSLAEAKPVEAAPQPAGGVEGFGREFWQRANPLEWVKGLVEAAKHPADAALGIIKADPKFLEQAQEHAAKGDYLTAGRKVLSYLSMGFGHDLDKQADLLNEGRYAEGVGAMAGMATQFVAPEVAARGVAAAPSLRPNLKPANPAIREAVEFGKANGVALDAATATDNAAVRGIQHLADRSVGGAAVAGRKAQAQAEGLATLGEQLAAKGHPVPMTRELAGQGTRDALLGQVRQHAGDADEAYTALRTIEADPANANTITPDVHVIPDDAPVRFTNKPTALPDEVFESVYADAKQNGYTGTKGALRREFDDQLGVGYRGLDEADAGAAALSPEALLADIRKHGGLKPFDKEGIVGAGSTTYRGEYQSIQQGFNSYTSGWSQRGGAQIFRNNGLTLDGMREALSQNPKWASITESTNDLLDALNEVARGGPSQVVKPGVEDALQVAGVKPGSRWWQKDAEPQTIPMAVDLRPARAAFADTYQALKREAELVPLMGDKARALTALDRLMSGPEHAPLSVVDAALGELKTFARSDVPELRTIGQGKVAGAIKHLDAAVRERAAQAGPLAEEALDAGRRATVAKYEAAGVLEKLHAEPVKAYGQTVARQDAAIEQLRGIARQAPDELPKIGRAYLDDLLTQAKDGGAFAHADKLFAEWQKLGPETKRLLYKDPAYIKELDNFFLLAKQTAKNANPSGTAHAAALGATGAAAAHGLFTGNLAELATVVGTVAGSAGLSAFLHSPAGVRILTGGLRLPPSAAAKAQWLARVKAFAAAQGAVQTAKAPAGSIQ